MRKCPESSAFDSRVAPVACEVALTVAPEITDPVLSVTVPEKLPVAWPYRSGQMGKTSEQNTTSSVLLVSIDLSLGGARRVANGLALFPTKLWKSPIAMRTI